MGRLNLNNLEVPGPDISKTYGAVANLSSELLLELKNNILPYWTTKMIDDVNGGFYGQITGDEILNKSADKGAILNARILWTFSSAYRTLRSKEYLDVASKARDYLLKYFVDKEFGGIYWALDCKGEVVDSKKQIYALGFAIYGLSEYHRATGDQSSLDAAINLFETIEKYAYDPKMGGYFEAMTRDWQEIDDMRLSDKDANERKTMNTHLHILEPYTNLYRVWKSDKLKGKLKELIDIFLDHIVDNETSHLKLFFSDDWSCRSNIVSYGHDIEASWLIHEAALVLGDKELLSRVEPIVVAIAKAAEEGLSGGGGIYYELDTITNHTDKDFHWWPQAEAVVGYYNIFQYFGNERALAISLNCWNYIKRNLIDRDNGEWYWSISDGKPNLKDDKAGFWKCPYHNGRMCLEIIERNQNLL